MAPTSYGFAKIKSNMKFNCYVVSGKSSLQKVTAATKLEDSWLLGRKAMTNLDIVLKSKSINSSVLSLLYGPTLTSIHDYWKNHSFDYMDICWQTNVSVF